MFVYIYITLSWMYINTGERSNSGKHNWNQLNFNFVRLFTFKGVREVTILFLWLWPYNPCSFIKPPNEQPIKLALNKDQKKTIKNNLKIKKIKKNHNQHTLTQCCFGGFFSFLHLYSQLICMHTGVQYIHYTDTNRMIRTGMCIHCTSNWLLLIHKWGSEIYIMLHASWQLNNTRSVFNTLSWPASSCRLKYMYM